MELLEFDNVSFNDLNISNLSWSEYSRVQKQKSFLKDQNYRANAKKNGFYKYGKPYLPTYRKNKFGFRTDEFFITDSFIALGDSNTYGAYQHEDRTWPYYLTELLGIKNFNLGVPGSSIDQCYVILKKYIELIKPQYVFFLIPNLNRNYTWLGDNFRVYNSEPESTFSSNTSLKSKYENLTLAVMDSVELDNINSTQHQELKYYKYLDAIYNVCQEHNATLIHLLDPSASHRVQFKVPDMTIDDSYALDFKHYGHLFMIRVANYFFKYYDSKGNSQDFI